MSDIMTLIQAAYAIPSGAVLDGNRIQNAVEGSDRTTSIFAAEMSVELRAEWNAILGYTRLPHMDQGGRADAMLTSDVVAPVSAALDVLVVDDVLMNREIAGTFLRAGGHRVVCVEGGTEAVAAVAITDFDVVLMDVRMPKMDGLEATRRIRALEGARGRVPIVALTAHAFTEQVAECRNAGMDSHLAKPFNPGMLLAAVARVSAPELWVLNPTVFERTAFFLAPDTVTSYLRTIAEGGEALLRRLRKPDALSSAGNELAEAAHTLAGSAGMLGFERLAALGSRFERAVLSSPTEAPVLVDGLSAALEATLKEIRHRTSAALTTTCSETTRWRLAG